MQRLTTRCDAPLRAPRGRRMTDWLAEDYPYRIEVHVGGRLRQKCRMVPVSCHIDFGKVLASHGARREDFEAGSIVVICCDADGRRVVYDPEKRGEQRYVVPHRFDGAYGGYALPLCNSSVSKGSLTWLMKDACVRTFHVYFDVRRPAGRHRRLDQQYTPLIGDAEKIRVGVPGPMVTTVRPQAPVFRDLDGDGRMEMFITTQCWHKRGEGIMAFKDVAARKSGPVYQELGLLRDEKGRIISYDPPLHVCGIGDLRGSGKDDIVGVPFDCRLRTYMGIANHLVWYENVGDTSNRWRFRYRGMLRDKKGRPVRLYDPQHPVHNMHMQAALQFADVNGDGRDEILCVMQDRLMLLADNGNGFEAAPLLDENGREIAVSLEASEVLAYCSATLVDLDGDGKLDLLLADTGGSRFPARRKALARRGMFSDSSLTWYRNVGTRREPRFRFEGLITVDGVEGRRLPPGSSKGVFVVGIGREPATGDLLVSPTEACVPYIYRYAVRRAQRRIELRGRGRLRGFSAIDCQQCNAILADLDGDGKKELLAGHMSGRLQFLRNVGTRMNPRFTAPVWVRNEAGRVIHVCESTDPYGQFVTNECRFFACDFSGNGLPDLLMGSGLGRVYYLENLGVRGGRGAPRFRNHGVLRDAGGNEVKVFDRCMPQVIPNLFGAGKRYLVVGGSHSGWAGHTGLSTDPAVDPELLAMARKALGYGKDVVFKIDYHRATHAVGHGISALKVYELKGLDGRGVPVLGEPVRLDTGTVFKSSRAYPFLVDWDDDGQWAIIHRTKLFRVGGTFQKPTVKYWKELPFGRKLIEKRLAGMFVGNEGAGVYSLDDDTDMMLLSDEPFCLYGVRRSWLENGPVARVTAAGCQNIGEGSGLKPLSRPLVVPENIIRRYPKR